MKFPGRIKTKQQAYTRIERLASQIVRWSAETSHSHKTFWLMAMAFRQTHTKEYNQMQRVALQSDGIGQS